VGSTAGYLDTNKLAVSRCAVLWIRCTRKRMGPMRRETNCESLLHAGSLALAGGFASLTRLDSRCGELSRRAIVQLSFASGANPIHVQAWNPSSGAGPRTDKVRGKGAEVARKDKLPEGFDRLLGRLTYLVDD
jgi:hypothetical protein